MSVLFKALQKAEKENEQRQTSSGSGFDAGRLAGSGAIRVAGSRGANWRTAGISIVLLLGVGLIAALFLVETGTETPTRVAMKPAVVTPPPQPVPQASADATSAPQSPVNASEAASGAVAPDVAANATSVAPAPVTPAPVTPAPPAQQVASAPVPSAPEADPAPTAQAEPAPQQLAADEEPAAPSVREAAKPAPRQAAVAAPPQREPMPDIAVDSPARMLSPPIAIQRSEFQIAGVGNAVRVREVSQTAQDNVSAGYNALVAGSYDTALTSYDRALKEEPTSVLAHIGRGAALQKLGRFDEANASYERALKIDPNNREALSNLTVILGESAPAQALNKLLDLEKQYPQFSPLKAQIGLTYAKVGSMAQALDYLSRASAMSPDSVMFRYNLALVLDHLGRSAQAVSAYETVLASLSSGRAAPELSSIDIERRVNYLRAR